jgi:hypothetical protein
MLSRPVRCIGLRHRDRHRHTGYQIPEVEKIDATSCFICLLLGYVSYRPYDFIAFLETCFSLRGRSNFPQKRALRKTRVFKNVKSLIPRRVHLQAQRLRVGVENPRPHPA